MSRATFWTEQTKELFPQYGWVVSQLDPKTDLDALVIELEVAGMGRAQVIRDAILAQLTHSYLRRSLDPRVILQAGANWDRRLLTWVAVQGAKDVVPLLGGSVPAAERAIVTTERWVMGKTVPKTVQHYANQTCRAWPKLEKTYQSYATHAACLATTMPFVPADQLTQTLQSVFANARVAWEEADHKQSDPDERVAAYNAIQSETIERALLTFPVLEKA